jgi:hypothetical protein
MSLTIFKLMAVLLTCMCQNTRVKPGALQQNVVLLDMALNCMEQKAGYCMTRTNEEGSSPHTSPSGKICCGIEACCGIESLNSIQDYQPRLIV